MFLFVVRVLGGRGEFRQVIFAGTKLLRLPRVGEGLGVQLMVTEQLAEPSVVVGAVHRGVDVVWEGGLVLASGCGIVSWGYGGGRGGAEAVDWVCGARGGGREGGGADTRCDRSRRTEVRGRSSSEVVTSFARTEEMSGIFSRSYSFSLESSASRGLTVSSCLLMVTMPETAAQGIDRMEPSPAEMVLRAWGERSWTSCGGRWSLSLISEKRSQRKSRGGVVLGEGEGEAGSARRGVPALEMALASS